MANNKVQLSNGTVIIDLTSDTVTSASHIKSGLVGHLKDGSTVTGTLVEKDVKSVTYNLSGGATASISTSEVVTGQGFSVKLTAPTGYVLSGVTVTMGGTDITSQVFTPDEAGGGGSSVTVTEEANATGITCVITTGSEPTPPTPSGDWEVLYENANELILSGTPNYMYISDYTYPFQSGETYRVMIDQTEYVCQSQEAPQSLSAYDGYCIGNLGLIGGTDSGEPFLMYRQSSSVLVNGTTLSAGTVYFKIERQE